VSGHIQSRLPFLPVSAPSGVPAEHFPQNPRNNTFITMNEHLQTRVARATGPYRPATRRTERVRRSFCPRTPFVIGASSFFRHSTFVIRHFQTEIIKNPRNITFYALKPHTTMTQRIVANPWAVGRVTPCAPLLTSQRTSFPNRGHPNASLLRNTLCKCLFLQHVTPAASASHSSGHVAPGFPLPAVAGRMEKSSATYFRIQRHLFSEFAAAGPLETAALRQNGYSTLSGFKPQESRSDTGY